MQSTRPGATELDLGPRRSTDLRNGLIAVAGPLVIVGIAYLLWSVSDRLLYVGPMDRATFGWLVVIPIWAVTPFAAGHLWHRLDFEAPGTAAIVCGLVIGGIAATTFWLDVSSPGSCQFGAARQPAEWLIPAAIFGIIIGGGFTSACLIAAGLVRSDGQLLGLILSVIIQVAVPVLSSIYLFVVTFNAICLRPPA